MEDNVQDMEDVGVNEKPIKGNSAFISKEIFRKKTTYIPCEKHGVFDIFNDAKELCTASSELESENINIGLTFVYPCITKNIYAHILKPNRLLKMHSGYDLILEISGVAWDRMTENERLALLHHELEHVNFKLDKKEVFHLRLVDHTIKDFYNILDTYGLLYIRPGLNETEDEGEE
jgi:hypothetical protein